MQTSFLVERAEGRVSLVDCGATTLVALRRDGVDPSSIDEVLVTHLHGDHFGGLPFLILDQHYVAGRTRPLGLAGPPGLLDRLRLAMAAFFPGSAELDVDFPLEVREIEAGVECETGAGRLVAFEVDHPSGAPSYGFRIESERVLAFSGDTEWVDELPVLARGADLFFCECYGLEKGVPHHLELSALRERRSELRCDRILLTHLGPEAVANLDAFEAAGFEVAFDGQEIELG